MSKKIIGVTVGTPINPKKFGGSDESFIRDYVDTKVDNRLYEQNADYGLDRVYYIASGEPVETTERSVLVPEGKGIIVCAVNDTDEGGYSYIDANGNPIDAPETNNALKTPKVTIINNVATWEEVEGATKYKYLLGNVTSYKSNKSFADTQNRVLVEQSKGRGLDVYYTLSSVEAPKSPSPEYFAKGSKLGSIPYRHPSGYMLSPAIDASAASMEKLESYGYNLDTYILPKKYTDSYVAKYVAENAPFTATEDHAIVQKGGEGKGSVTGPLSSAFGYNHTIDGQYSTGFGEKQTIHGKRSLGAGYLNTIADGAYNSAAFGYKNSIDHHSTFEFGTSLKSANPKQMWIGELNKPIAKDARGWDLLFGVGNGTADTEEGRSNAFEVYKDGRATIGKAPTNAMDVANKGYVDNLLLNTSSIENVTKLPSEKDLNKLYRLFTATFIHNRHMVDNSICYCVESLPETGEPATDGNQAIRAYYNMQDGKVYGYLDAALAGAFGIPAGWYDAATLLAAQGWSYAGVISDINLDPNDSTIRVLLNTALYIPTEDGWKELTNDELNKRFPIITELGHWVHTVQNRDGKEPEYIPLSISHSPNNAAKYQIPLREDGKIKTQSPWERLDCANKEYVDTEIDNRAYGNLEKRYHTTNIHYYTDENNQGNASIGLHQNAEDSEQEHIPLRQRNGLMTCNVPEGAGDNAVVNKKYVGNTIKALLDRIEALEAKLAVIEGQGGIMLNVGIYDDGQGNVTLESLPNGDEVEY